MQINRKRLSRGALVVSGASMLAVLATGLVPVAAQVIGDPLGLISVGTSGESTNGSAVAVSNGGNAAGGTNGVGISTTGSGSGGLVGASGTGCASTGSTYAFAPTAVSGTGCANGFGTAISGSGTACGSGLVGLSATGDSCGFVALSPKGTAYGTYSLDGNGEVRAEGQAIAVYTGMGGGANMTPDQLNDVTYTPPASLIEAKNLEATKLEPSIIEHLAQYATTVSTATPPVQTTPASGSKGVGMGTASTGQNEPPSMTLNHAWEKEEDGKCGPESTRLVMLTDWNDTTSQDQYASEEKWDYHAGVYYKSVVRALNNHYQHYWSSPFYEYERPDFKGNMADLMSWIVDDVYNYSNSLVNPIDPDGFSYWMKFGYTSPKGHYNVTYGYDEYGTGHVWVFDEFHNPQTTDKVYGEWKITLHELFAGLEGGKNSDQMMIW